MDEKKLTAIHEAGHVTMFLFWDLPWKHAQLKRGKNGGWGGSVFNGSYQFMEVTEGKDGLIKDWTMLLGGISAEEVFLKKRIGPDDPHYFSAAKDIVTADKLAMKYIDENYYVRHFRPNFKEWTRQVLMNSLDNCVLVIANELYRKNVIVPPTINKIIVQPQSPRKELIELLMKDVLWKV